MARAWEDKIRTKLRVKVDEKHRVNFNEWLKDGNKLSYAELKELNSVLKGDYVG